MAAHAGRTGWEGCPLIIQKALEVKGEPPPQTHSGPLTSGQLGLNPPPHPGTSRGTKSVHLQTNTPNP